MKIKNISNLWKGRLKRRNFFIFVLILGVLLVISSNYLPDTPLVLVLILIIALYTLCLSIRRAQDIGIRKVWVNAIAVFYGIQILAGIILTFCVAAGYVSIFTAMLLSSFLNLISLPIGLYLLCAKSEKKDNIYGVYEERTSKSFINDIFNIK